jgi:hypothetical protein
MIKIEKTLSKQILQHKLEGEKQISLEKDQKMSFINYFAYDRTRPRELNHVEDIFTFGTDVET